MEDPEIARAIVTACRDTLGKVLFWFCDALLLAIVVMAAADGLWLYSGFILLVMIFVVCATWTSRRALVANLPLAEGSGSRDGST